MSKNFKHVMIHVCVEDCVKNHETKFCVVCFFGSDDILDVVVTDNFESTLCEFAENHLEDVRLDGFHVQVVSTRTFLEVMEAIKK